LIQLVDPRFTLIYVGAYVHTTVKIVFANEDLKLIWDQCNYRAK